MRPQPMKVRFGLLGEYDVKNAGLNSGARRRTASLTMSSLYVRTTENRLWFHTGTGGPQYEENTNTIRRE